jgi:hypothetical protein
MYVYPISMNTSEKLSRLDLKIYKIGYQKHITVYHILPEKIGLLDEPCMHIHSAVQSGNYKVF